MLLRFEPSQAFSKPRVWQLSSCQSSAVCVLSTSTGCFLFFILSAAVRPHLVFFSQPPNTQVIYTTTFSFPHSTSYFTAHTLPHVSPLSSLSLSLSLSLTHTHTHTHTHTPDPRSHLLVQCRHIKAPFKDLVKG